jgi:hypothetical protein
MSHLACGFPTPLTTDHYGPVRGDIPSDWGRFLLLFFSILLLWLLFFAFFAFLSFMRWGNGRWMGMAAAKCRTQQG